MNEPPGNSNGSNDTKDNQEEVPPPSAPHSEEKAKSEDPDNHEHEPAYIHYVKQGVIRRRWNEFWRAGIDRHIELILAAAIAFFAWAQWHTATENNAATGKQVDRLIFAANGVRDAADSFSGSAAKINTGVANAVTQLGIQADKLEAARRSSVKESEKALDTTIENARLDQRAWLGVTDMSPAPLKHGDDQVYIAEGQPVPDIKVFIGNSGKTPAILTDSNIRWMISPTARPFEHAYFMDESPNSIMVVQPSMTGRSVKVSSNPDQVAPTGGVIESIRSGILIMRLYGELKYRDVFKVEHTTHFCLVLKQDLKAWDGCDTYNDAD